MIYMTFMLYFSIFLSILLYPHIASLQNCGIERWSVKTLSDMDTLRIDFKNIITSTVHEQVGLPEPDNKTSRLDNEIEVYSIDCLLIGYKFEDSDKDIHIIVE